MKKYDNFCKALENLSEGARLNPPYSIVEQTGIEALFEICFEQSWKLMKAVLEDHGRFESKIGHTIHNSAGKLLIKRSPHSECNLNVETFCLIF